MYSKAIFSKVNPETKEIKRPFVSHKANPAAIKIHKDGRLFVCYLGDFKSTGGILQLQKMVTTYKILLKIFQQLIVLMTWYLILKVDFYFTDFRGYSTNPLGAFIMLRRTLEQ